MRRVRSSGGRFAKKTETDDKNATSSTKKRAHSDTYITNHQEPRDRMVNSCNGNGDTRGGMVNSCNGGARYDNQESFKGSYSSDIGEGGGSLGQQWTKLPSNQTSQRAVAMK